MRIVTSPVSNAQMQPVRASDAVRSRVRRDQEPVAVVKAADPVKNARPSSSSLQNVSGDRQLVSGAPALVSVSVTSQRVFHAFYEDRPEESLVHANRAYSKTDSLKFRDIPFTLRVA